MDNIGIYQASFKVAFSLQEPILYEDLKYQALDSWDSVGHMELITHLENAFKISMEMDDVIDFSSYSIGKDIVGKYGITFD